MIKQSIRVIEAVESHSPLPFKIAVRAVEASCNLFNSSAALPALPNLSARPTHTKLSRQLSNCLLETTSTSESHNHLGMNSRDIKHK